MKVYFVYSSVKGRQVTTDKKKAELFCAMHNNGSHIDYKIEEYETDDFDLNSLEEKNEVGYGYTVYLLMDRGQIIKESIEGPTVLFKRSNTIKMRSNIFDTYIINVWLPKENEECARKIAYEMIIEKEKELYPDFKEILKFFRLE